MQPPILCRYRCDDMRRVIMIVVEVLVAGLSAFTQQLLIQVWLLSITIILRLMTQKSMKFIRIRKIIYTDLLSNVV